MAMIYHHQQSTLTATPNTTNKQQLATNQHPTAIDQQPSTTNHNHTNTTISYLKVRLKHNNIRQFMT